jgi:hypothetical protein
VEFESADEDVVDEEQHRMTDHAGLLAALDAWGPETSTTVPTTSTPSRAW